MTPTGAFQPEQSVELSGSWGRMSETREFIIESPKHGKHTVLIDEGDWELVSQYNWYLWSGNTHNTLYAKTNKLGYLHRLVLDAPPGTMIDHANGNGLDNRKANLRFCDKAQNQANQRRNNSNSSGYKGVARVSKTSSKWRAYIRNDYKQIHLGNFTLKEEAARAYDAKAIELFGEYASLNFPEEHNRKDSE